MLNKKILQTFYALLSKDIEIYNKKLLPRTIDAFVWAGSNLIIAHNIMPLFGIQDPQYGTFILIGNLAIWGLFEMLTTIAIFLGDIEGDRTISYYISLPIPTSLFFVEQALASAYRSMASSILIFPLGKLILGDALLLSSINWPCFLIAFAMINVFYGFLTLLVASYVSDLPSLTMVRSRIMFPLWFLGGFQFPWKMLHGVAPTFAYMNLCNPITYIMEGIRSTALPTQNYLPFWNCMAMLVFFSMLCGYIGIRNLKKRLDCL